MIIQPPNTNLIINADCLTALKALPDNSVDSVVTDPPYGLGFMGKQWFNFDAIRKITTGKQFGYPNGYWKIPEELNDALHEVQLNVKEVSE